MRLTHPLWDPSFSKRSLVLVEEQSKNPQVQKALAGMCVNPANEEEGPRGRKKLFPFGFLILSFFFLSFFNPFFILLKIIISYFNKYLIMERKGKATSNKEL